jgi:hypothetical protein
MPNFRILPTQKLAPAWRTAVRNGPAPFSTKGLGETQRRFLELAQASQARPWFAEELDSWVNALFSSAQLALKAQGVRFGTEEGDRALRIDIQGEHPLNQYAAEVFASSGAVLEYVPRSVLGASSAAEFVDESPPAILLGHSQIADAAKISQDLRHENVHADAQAAEDAGQPWALHGFVSALGEGRLAKVSVEPAYRTGVAFDELQAHLNTVLLQVEQVVSSGSEHERKSLAYRNAWLLDVALRSEGCLRRALKALEVIPADYLRTEEGSLQMEILPKSRPEHEMGVVVPQPAGTPYGDDKAQIRRMLELAHTYVAAARLTQALLDSEPPREAWSVLQKFLRELDESRVDGKVAWTFPDLVETFNREINHASG